MKLILMMVLFGSQAVFADDLKKTAPPATNPPSVMVKDAKKICKDSGKQGAELLKCIKEKKGAD